MIDNGREKPGTLEENAVLMLKQWWRTDPESLWSTRRVAGWFAADRCFDVTDDVLHRILQHGRLRGYWISRGRNRWALRDAAALPPYLRRQAARLRAGELAPRKAALVRLAGLSAALSVPLDVARRFRRRGGLLTIDEVLEIRSARGSVTDVVRQFNIRPALVLEIWGRRWAKERR